MVDNNKSNKQTKKLNKQPIYLQDEKNQILTTNAWLNLVSGMYPTYTIKQSKSFSTQFF